MLYLKNVPTFERALRLIAGVSALVFAGKSWDTSEVAVGAGIVGATLALTGLVGFCPMCAMLGRKLDRGQ